MNKKTYKKRTNRKSFTGAFALILSLLLVNACSTAVEERVEQVGGVTAQQIIDNPQAYVGKIVTVSGNIEEIFEPRAFNIDSGASVGELLVIGKSPFPQVPGTPERAIVSGDIATVTGVVRMMTTVTDVEKEIGWDLTSEIETTYKTKPVLVARDSSFRSGIITGETPVSKVDDVNDTNSNLDRKVVENSDDSNIVTFSDYEKAVDRRSYVGKRVRLEAVDVESVAGDNTFFVGTSPTKRILIVFQEEATPNSPVEGKVDIDKGQKVTIEGVVKLMPPIAEAKRQFGALMSAETLNSLKNETTYIYTDDPRIVQGAK